MTNALYRRIEASEKFAADVAHELKNPLAAARSTAEALAYAKSDADRTQLVQEIQTELKRLNRLINDISSTSRLDAELARQEMQPIDLRGVLGNVTGLFTDMLADDSRKIRIDRGAGSTDRPITVRGNDGRLGQVFTNLIDNALSFSPDGGTVTVRAQPNGSKIEIAIEDEGPGIPSTSSARSSTGSTATGRRPTAKRGKNSGLGLSISREIVVSHQRRDLRREPRFERTAARRTARGSRFACRCRPTRGAGLVWRSLSASTQRRLRSARRGALIRGPSGSGKSDLALRCSGTRSVGDFSETPVKLVADDQVILTSEGLAALLRRRPFVLRGRLEVRGVGILEVAAADEARRRPRRRSRARRPDRKASRSLADRPYTGLGSSR